MPEREFNRTLEELHQELQQIESPDAQSRAKLQSLSEEIQEILARSGESPRPEDRSFMDRLERSAEEWEVSHPRLTQLANHIAHLLSNMGI
jgi:chromosome segregation ATPase